MDATTERTAEQDALHDELTRAANDFGFVMDVLKVRGGRRDRRTLAAELLAETAELGAVLTRVMSNELIEDQYCVAATEKFRRATELAGSLIDFRNARQGGR